VQVCKINAKHCIYAFQDLAMKHSLRSHEAFALQTRSIELKFNMKQSVPLIKHAPKVRFIGQSPASFFMCEARFISKKKKHFRRSAFLFDSMSHFRTVALITHI
jgi:hypothetical protein